MEHTHINKKDRGDKYTVLSLCLIVLFASIIYVNSIFNEFVMDDVTMIAQNLSIRKMSNIWGLLISSYRPLRFISFALDYHFWGLNPVGYHITNILLHVISSLLVYMITRKMVKDVRVSLYAAILFAVHPVHTDAVTYLSGRRDILSAAFYFTAFYCFLYYRGSGKYRYIPLIFGSFFLSLLSKEMAASFPFLLLGYDAIFRFNSKYALLNTGFYLDMLRSVWHALKRDILFYFILFLIIPISVYYYVVMRHASLVVTQGRIEWWGGTILLNFMNALHVLVYYIKKSLLPVVLVADNSAFPVIQSFQDGRVAASLAMAFFLIVLFLIWMKQNKTYAFSLAFFLITLLPVMQIIPHHELLAEHYLYVPSFGLCLVMGLCFKSLGEYSKRITSFTFLLFALICLLFSIRTLERNKDWANEFTIYHKDLQVYPQNRRVHLVLGKAYMDVFLYEMAMLEFNMAVQGEKVFKEAYAYKSYILYKRGEIESAIEEAEKALSVGELEFARFNLGKYYQTMGDEKKALFHFDKVPSGKLLLPSAVYSFQIYQKQWDQVNADRMADRIIQESERKLDDSPGDQETLRNLARCYEWRLRFDESVRVYDVLKSVAKDLSSDIFSRMGQIQEEKMSFLRASELLKKDPDNSDGLLQMGRLHFRIGRYADAFDFLKKVVEKDPSNPEALYYLARLYDQKKDLQNAMVYAKKAIDLRNHVPDYHYFLGLLYATDLHFDHAIEEFDQASSLGMKDTQFKADYIKALRNRTLYQNALLNDSRRLDLAGVYLDYQCPVRAVSILKDIEGNVNKDPEILLEIGSLYETMGHRYVGEAVRIYRRILEVDPEDAGAYTRLGYIYWKEVQDLPSVIHCFSTSLTLDPNQKQGDEMRRVVAELTELYKNLCEKSGMRIQDVLSGN